MSFAEEKAREEQLRTHHQRLSSQLEAMSNDDPNRSQVAGELRTLVVALRGKMVNEAMDVCSVPDCVEAGTVMVGNKQWCRFHAERQT
jgi:hypothetical protein